MQKIILAAIILVGFIARIIFIDQIPAGFTPDEASFGYDAYSILRTGKDQWGKPFPTVFESFGDFKSPLYTYLTIPTVAIFGLSKFSVRLPNAMIGTLAILSVYLLSTELFRLLKGKSQIINLKYFPIVSAFILSVSPWHIMMSRGAFEANLTTFFLTAGIYFFLRGFSDSKQFIFSVLLLSLNMFTYHSAKFLTPVMLISLFFLYKKQVFKIEKGRLVALLVGVIFFVIFILSLYGGSSTRIKNTSILGRALLEASDERIKAINMGMNPVLARVVYNKYQAGLRRFTLNYLSYFSPQFYFTNGPAEGTYGMIPGRGVLYWLDVVFLISFFVYVARNYKEKILWILVIWLLASPIPAALSIGPGYAANRAESMIPTVQIILAIGLIHIYQKIKNFRYINVATAFFSLMYLGFIIYFGLEYYLLSPLKNGKSMLWGSLKSAQYVSENYPDKKVFVSRSLSEPHIYFAFASNYDPSNYQEDTKSWDYQKNGLDWVDQMPRYELGNFVFSNINNKSIKNKEFDVFVAKPEEFDTGTIPSYIIYNPDGTESVYIVAF